MKNKHSRIAVIAILSITTLLVSCKKTANQTAVQIEAQKIDNIKKMLLSPNATNQFIWDSICTGVGTSSYVNDVQTSYKATLNFTSNYNCISYNLDGGGTYDTLIYAVPSDSTIQLTNTRPSQGTTGSYDFKIVQFANNKLILYSPDLKEEEYLHY